MYTITQIYYISCSIFIMFLSAYLIKKEREKDLEENMIIIWWMIFGLMLWGIVV